MHDEQPKFASGFWMPDPARLTNQQSMEQHSSAERVVFLEARLAAAENVVEAARAVAMHEGTEVAYARAVAFRRALAAYDAHKKEKP